MQVPPDLAIRLSSLAMSSGIAPDVFLRQAVSQWFQQEPSSLPETMTALPVPADAAERVFVPQTRMFSVYE